MGDGANQSWGAKNRNKQWHEAPLQNWIGMSIQKQVTINFLGISSNWLESNCCFFSEMHAKIKPGGKFSYFISKFARKRTDVEPFPSLSTYLRSWFFDHRALSLWLVHGVSFTDFKYNQFAFSGFSDWWTRNKVCPICFLIPSVLPQWNWSKTYQSPSLPCTPVRHWLSAPQNLVISQFFLEKWSKHLVAEDEITKKKRKWSSSLHFPTCKQATHQPKSEAWSCWIRESCKRDDLAIFCLKKPAILRATILRSFGDVGLQGGSRRGCPVVLLLWIFAKEQQVFQLPSEFSQKKIMAQSASRFMPNNRTQMF